MKSIPLVGADGIDNALSFAALIGCTTALLIAVNPHWYGDATWYAIAIHSGELLPLDAGHLLWRPVGAFAVSVATLFSFSLDPLLALQIISAFSTVLSSIFLYEIAIALQLKAAPAIPVAYLLSHFSLVYGGSGSSYSTSVMFHLLAVKWCLQSEATSKARTIVFCGIASALSLSFWGLGILGIPLLMAIPFVSWKNSIQTKFMYSMAIPFSAMSLFGATLIIGFLTTESNTTFANFFVWLRSSGHGIPAELSLLNLLRAPLGLIQSVLYLGDLGTALKSFISGGGNQYVPVLPLVLLVSFFVYFGGVFILQWNGIVSSKLFLLFIASLAPSFLFGALWQGSDIERFCFVLPYFLLLLADLSARSFLKGYLSVTPAIAFCLWNFTSIAVTYEQDHEELITEIAKQTTLSAPPKSIFVVTGQDFGPRIWAPLHYLTGHTFYSLLYDSQVEGVAGWQNRLEQTIKQHLEAGGKLYVLDSLYSVKPESPKPTLTDADNHPSEGDIAKLFHHSNGGQKIVAKRYHFRELAYRDSRNRQQDNSNRRTFDINE